MKKLILMSAALFTAVLFTNGQKTTPKSSPGKRPAKASNIKMNKITLPNDTATVPALNVNPPVDKTFDPSNSKIKNLPVKTPMYNSTLTGSSAPGDVNTGIPANQAPTPAVKYNVADSTRN